jgi:hypothetical protein
VSFPVYASIVLFGVCLRNNCNTRYEWLVRPYSPGTFTLEETPSFAWRTNGLADSPPRGHCPQRGYDAGNGGLGGEELGNGETVYCHANIAVTVIPVLTYALSVFGKRINIKPIMPMKPPEINR